MSYEDCFIHSNFQTGLGQTSQPLLGSSRRQRVKTFSNFFSDIESILFQYKKNLAFLVEL